MNCSTWICFLQQVLGSLIHIEQCVLLHNSRYITVDTLTDTQHIFSSTIHCRYSKFIHSVLYTNSFAECQYFHSFMYVLWIHEWIQFIDLCTDFFSEGQHVGHSQHLVAMVTDSTRNSVPRFEFIYCVYSYIDYICIYSLLHIIDWYM